MTNIVPEEVKTTQGIKKQALRLLGGLAFAFVVSIALLFLVAAIAYWSDIPERFIAPVATGVSLLSLFFGAQIAGKGTHWFWFGAILGVLYYVILYICALAMFADFNFSLRTAIFMLIGALTGGVGSAVGGAQPEKKSKHRKKKK